MSISVLTESGFSIHDFGDVGSTNDEARRLAEDGAPDRTAVLGRSQSAGRGRRGRVWTSPPGNLYVSLLLRPECPISAAAQISLVAALGLGDAIGALTDEGRIQNKWPNDVLVDGKKIAGLLLESSGAENPLVEWVIVGCGVNIAQMPDVADYETTCLNAAAERNVPVAACLTGFLSAFDTRYETWRRDGIGPIREAWLSRAAGLGREITVRLPNREMRGVFEGMDSSGALVLALSGGEREVITAGDIFA